VVERPEIYETASLDEGDELHKELSSEDLEAEIERDAQAEAAKQKKADNAPDWVKTRTVTVYGREFVIEPPNIGVTLRIINIFGRLGIRGEKAALLSLRTLADGMRGGAVPTVSGRAAVFGMLAALRVDDLYALGSAVLQFDKDTQGKAWLRKAPDGQDVPLAPLIQALFLNLMQSDDLKDGLTSFFDGLAVTETLLDGLPLSM